MSLEREPAVTVPSDNMPRILQASSNPAQRLQELLRREAQEARDAQEAREAQEVREAQEGSTPPEPLPDRNSAPYEAPVESAPCPPTPAPSAFSRTAQVITEPSVPVVIPALKRDPVLLIVVVNSERNTPVEYPSLDDLPTVNALEEAHGAFLLSDEWQRRGPILTRIIRLRRRRR